MILIFPFLCCCGIGGSFSFFPPVFVSPEAGRVYTTSGHLNHEKASSSAQRGYVNYVSVHTYIPEERLTMNKAPIPDSPVSTMVLFEITNCRSHPTRLHLEKDESTLSAHTADHRKSQVSRIPILTSSTKNKKGMPDGICAYLSA